MRRSARYDGYIRLELALTQANPTIAPYDQEAGAELIDSSLPIGPSLAVVDGLTERFARLARVISVEGAVWAVLPNKRHASQRGISFSWEQMQAAGLRTDLVDNKIVSLSPEEYATRFVIRKDRRARYT